MKIFNKKTSIASLYVGVMFSLGAQPNQLLKCYYHPGFGLEIGSLSLCFSHKPSIKKPQALNKFSKSLDLFIPDAAISIDNIAVLLEHINKQCSKSQSIALTPMNKGIQVRITYDPELLEIKYGFFDSITTQKGLIITFFDKKLLEALHEKTNKHILHSVCNTSHGGIVLDCGHGGQDTGAIGFFNIKEKDITLDVGLKVADILKKKGFRVIMTRSHDCDVPLDGRTLCANQHVHADILVSIHANYSYNAAACGIETYCLNDAAIEPLFSTLPASHEKVVKTLHASKINKSNTLAHHVHTNVLDSVHKKYAINNRNIKHAVAQVLLGSDKPGALIELGFISNKWEASLLQKKEYRQLLAQGICNGIISYFATEKIS